ncbi:MAG TPA: PQQ-binding-like beta-propeller repeat protein [Thermoanaerobaculia bacterium]|jgi:outer membrane protein assembly factor BamB
MTSVNTDETDLRKPLRLWPGVAFALLLFVTLYVVPIFVPGAMLFGLIGASVGALGILLWWLFFSRAAWMERLGALVLATVAMAVTYRFLDESVRRGNMGFQYFVLAIPVLTLAFVAWAVASRRFSDALRRATMVATILLACGAWTAVRSKGVTSAGMAQLTWRWTQTPEQRLLAQADDEPTAIASVPAAEPQPSPPIVAETRPQWPGLRGPERDGIVPGVRIETDWSRSPPVELWRRPIGPGVSSFAVGGDVLYTQEQRGEDEIVGAYDVTTGEPVWRHRDAARFWDPHVDAGPRATPALAGECVYTLGATGILNALDADDGAVVWSLDVTSDAGAKLPTWGFVSSPLVVDDLLVVAAGSLLAYDLATGAARWRALPGRGSYSSPHLLTIAGVPQILLIGHAAVFSVAPADGTLLWEHPWPGFGIVQPARIAEGDLLISMIDAAAVPVGTRRIAVAHGPAGWSVEERWTSHRLKPSFSGFVAHEGHAYGFDGSILACIDLESGEREWKGGRYGQGQLLLLPDQDLLLVLSEQGELALVEAIPDRFTQLARLPVLEGKTWSQPALVGDVLLVRNGLEMAGFRLAARAPV